MIQLSAEMRYTAIAPNLLREKLNIEVTENNLPQSPLVLQDLLLLALLLVVPHLFGQDIFPHIRMSNLDIEGCAQTICWHFLHLQKLMVT